MKKVLILLGPTGVGKTGASLLLASALGTEIISADSMQIYRGMDIGTAKPSREERAAVPHHMIDIADPRESFSAGRYLEMVAPIIEGLHSRGKIPLVVGGTGLYIKALTRGIFSGPGADWEMRESLLSEERGNPGVLYARLLGLDPEAARKIERNDTRRVLRALEVCLSGAGTMSSLQQELTIPLPYEYLKLGLIRSRDELYRMIDRRVDEMVRQGLVEEAGRILALNPDRTPLQAIGYKEFREYFAGRTGLEEVIEWVKRSSRRYAKRQFTWFARESGVGWIDITGIHDPRAIFRKVREYLMVTDPEIPLDPEPQDIGQVLE